jgi:leader peptidase (prepilin peptidase) / N-methyltransferase
VSVVVAVTCGILGLGVGALLNVAIARVPERRRSVLTGPFPELSRAGMRPASVTVIVATGALWAAIGARYHDESVLPAYLLLTAALVALSAVDLDLFILPNRMIYPSGLALFALLLGAAIADQDFHPLGRAVVCAVGAFVVFAVLHLISPRSMGFGDVRLSVLLGLGLGYLGWKYVALGLFLGFLYGAVIGVLLIVVRLRTRRDHVPFGPFLAAGALTALLWGDSILRGYQNK